jgi:hypothetical protein
LRRSGRETIFLREYVDNANWRCLQKGLFLKTGNRVDGCAGKRDSQLKPVAAFDLICVIYILPFFCHGNFLGGGGQAWQNAGSTAQLSLPWLGEQGLTRFICRANRRDLF